MSISTGDPRRSTPKKSTTAAATGASDPETTDDGPVGGVLPVKKVARPAGKSGNGGSAGRTAGNNSARTGGNGSSGSGSGGSSAATKRTTPAAKAAPAKATPTSGTTTPAKTSPTKTSPTKTSTTTTTSRRSTVTETLDSSVVGRRSTTKTGVPLFGSAGRPGGGRPTAGGTKTGGRRPITPVRVAERRNWGPIALFVGTGAAVLLIIGFGVWPLISSHFKPSWHDQARAIPGIVDYVDPDSPNYDAAVTQRNHQTGDLSYNESPPVGGNHNPYWQNCMGDVYTAQIADEHAVHAMEHGTVWITYNPDLPQAQIDQLAGKIRNLEYTMMSPYPGLDAPISLQAWGFQLKVQSADDGRIDDFIHDLRLNDTQEPGAACSGGITDTGATPVALDGSGM